MCVEECPPGYEPRPYDDYYQECVKDCDSEVVSDQINNPSDPHECLFCSDVIQDCLFCSSDDFGVTHKCFDCDHALVPDDNGLACVMEFCDDPNVENP